MKQVKIILMLGPQDGAEIDVAAPLPAQWLIPSLPTFSLIEEGGKWVDPVYMNGVYKHRSGTPYYDWQGWV